MKRSIVAVLCAVLVIAAVTLWIAEGYTPEGRQYAATSPPLPKVTRKRHCRWLIPVCPTIRGSS